MKQPKPDVNELNRKVKPVENFTGSRYPGTGGKLRAGRNPDVVDQMDEQRDLDVPQAGGEEPW